MINNGLYVVILMLLPSTACRGGEMAPDFLKRYGAEANELGNLCNQIRITATITEAKNNESLIYNIDLFEKMKSIKVISTYISGPKRHFGEDNVIIDVANPGKSFTLRKHSADGKLRVAFLSREDSDYDLMRRRAERLSLMVRATQSFFGIPLEQHLTRSETTIKSAEEENVSDGKLIHVQTYTLPYNDNFRKLGHHADGSFLLDPALHLALRSFNVKYWKKDGKQLWYELQGRNEYRPTDDGRPRLSLGTYELLGGNGKTIDGYRTEVTSVSFPEISSEEFTLKGCGLMADFESEESRGPAILYWSVGGVVVALALILVLRRRMAKKPRGAG